MIHAGYAKVSNEKRKLGVLAFPPVALRREFDFEASHE